MGEDKRKELLKSAKKLFLKDGYDKTSIRQIVTNAGTSIGNCYFYFKNKEDIVSEISSEVQDNLWKFVNRNFSSVPAVDSAIAVSVFLSFTFVFQNPDNMKFFLVSYRIPKLKREIFDRYLDNLKKHAGEDCQLPNAADLELFAVAAMGVLAAVVERKMAGELKQDNITLALYVTEICLKMSSASSAELEKTLKVLKDYYSGGKTL